MNNPPNDAPERNGSPVSPEGTDKGAKTAVKAVGLALGLMGILICGGMAVAWFIQGPVFYEEQTLHFEATVKGNGPGALGIDPSFVADESKRENFVDTRHWMVLSYPQCEAVHQGFWIPDVPRKGAKQAGVLNELRRCFLDFEVNSKVAVEVRTRKKRSSGERTWRVLSIGECDPRQLETLVNSQQGAQRCDWM